MNRECFTAEHRPKRRYLTRAAARMAIRQDTEGRLTGASVYRCPLCDYYHIGHYPSNPAARARLRDRHRTERNTA